jgi:hypothetical protein
MLRHSCGYKLANDGIDTRAIQDWLGHVSITRATRYTQLSPARFKDFWRGLIRDLAGAGNRAGRGRFAASNGVRSIRRQAANTMTAVLDPVPLSLQWVPSPSGPFPASIVGPVCGRMPLPGKR